MPTRKANICKVESSQYVKVWILQVVNSEKCNSDKLKIFSSQNGTCILIQVPICEEKVFNWSELHFSEVTSFKIHTLAG